MAEEKRLRIKEHLRQLELISDQPPVIVLKALACDHNLVLHFLNSTTTMIGALRDLYHCTIILLNDGTLFAHGMGTELSFKEAQEKAVVNLMREFNPIIKTPATSPGADSLIDILHSECMKEEMGQPQYTLEINPVTGLYIVHCTVLDYVTVGYGHRLIKAYQNAAFYMKRRILHGNWLPPVDGDIGEVE